MTLEEMVEIDLDALQDGLASMASLQRAMEFYGEPPKGIWRLFRGPAYTLKVVAFCYGYKQGVEDAIRLLELKLDGR